MDNLQYVPYNSSNTTRAKNNREQMTKSEQKIRFELLQNRPLGYKFIKQKMISSFILDFYCSELLMGVEIDGGIHEQQKEYDRERDEKLRHLGIVIIRFTNNEVTHNINGIYKNLIEEMIFRKQELEKFKISVSGQGEGALHEAAG